MTKKSPSKVNIPAIPTEISKWQKASVDLVHLKFRVHEILNQFSNEEKQSEQYKELTDILRGIIVHVIDEHGNVSVSGHHVPVSININTGEVEEESEEAEITPKKSSIKVLTAKVWNMPTLIVGLVGAIVASIAPYIADIIRAIFGTKGGP